jgi:hypothetical protein
MPDWNTRLAVDFTLDPTDDPNSFVPITPINTFSTTIGLVATELHSIEATHVGAVYAPRSIAFTMTLNAMGTAAAQLAALALKGTRFDIVVQVQEGTDWSFQSILLKNCIATQLQTNAPVSGAPTLTISGVALKATETPAANTPAPGDNPVTIPF